MEKLHKMFQQGAWTDARTGIRLKGKEIKAEQEESGDWILLLTQREFIKGLQGGRIPRSRAQQVPKLSPEETIEFSLDLAGDLFNGWQVKPDQMSPQE